VRSIGLDFGTSTTLVAVRDGDLRPRVVPLGSKTLWMPSVAGLDARGDLVVGEVAEKLPPQRQITSAKTLLGSGIDKIDVEGASVNVVDVVAALLSSAMDLAKKNDPTLFSKSDRVFVGCPSLWGLGPRTKLSSILRKLGLQVDVGDLIEEPIAAGIGWLGEKLGVSDAPNFREMIVVDAGGGTLDVAVLGFGDPNDVMESHSRVRIERMFVLASDSLQGSGDELDRRIAEAIAEGLGDNGEISLEVMRAARQLKEDLSIRETSTVKISSHKNAIKFDREELEKHGFELIRDFVNTSVFSSRAAMLRYERRADPVNIRGSEVSELSVSPEFVLMVGGTSQIPKVQEEIRRTFNDALIELADNPQTSVAVGLTFSTLVQGLNMPRPPRRIVVEELKDGLVVQRKVLHEAFEPTYSWSEIVKGHSHTGVQFSFAEGSYRFVAEHPTDPSKNELISSEIWSGKGHFKYYSNGDIIIRDNTKTLIGRVTGWPHFGKSLEVEVAENNVWQRPTYPYK